MAWMVEEKDIEPQVPVRDKTQRKNNIFSSNDFHWNEGAKEYRCPASNPLRSEWRAFNCPTFNRGVLSTIGAVELQILGTTRYA
ncbi:hypothetical protein ALQ29_00247 [Pseudomonas marginalis pv. marginalis]|uniref:Uncharacterized protein n=1 Tax=Pseudomonas marginalis pv. marginalis TaxID=97473 RepID=A0A3M3WCT4_PSEMA|nr:hypothetical protein ALQ38_01471 [Pseudomonas marginalis pv. marginalis]RMP03761.1 hypothetical protein ALQ29_00247 [Pseudomonas marginalis pv. marginalis]